jgi:GT2 family glycosyltransferase
MRDRNISIIIASRNVRDDLKKCLTSIFENYEKEEIEVIVSDNHSNDGTVKMVNESFPWIQVCNSAQNGGYPHTINCGLKAAIGEYLLLLDSDVIIQNNTIPELSSFLDIHPEVGAAVSKMFYPNGTVQFMARKFPSPFNAIFGSQTTLTKLFPNNRIAKRYLMVDEHYQSEPFEADWAATACMMIKREVIEHAGLMDEGYLLYWSDADWCRRIRAYDWKIFCIPTAEVIHDMRNESKKKKSNFAIKAFHQGVYRYFRKYYIKSPLHPLHLIALIGLGGRMGIQLLLNSLKSYSDVN